MAVAPVAAAPPSTRERLSRTALHLFAERGYNGVSNREIVEACGLTKGAIYWYFESKEHLFRTVVAEAMAEFEARVLASVAGAARWQDKLRSMFAVFIEVLDSHDDPQRDLLILMGQRLPSGPGQDTLGEASQRQFVEWVRSVLEESESAVPRDELAALVAVTGRGVLVEAASGQDSTQSRRALDALLELLGAGRLFSA